MRRSARRDCTHREAADRQHQNGVEYRWCYNSGAVSPTLSRTSITQNHTVPTIQPRGAHYAKSKRQNSHVYALLRVGIGILDRVPTTFISPTTGCNPCRGRSECLLESTSSFNSWKTRTTSPKGGSFRPTFTISPRLRLALAPVLSI